MDRYIERTCATISHRRSNNGGTLLAPAGQRIEWRIIALIEFPA